MLAETKRSDNAMAVILAGLDARGRRMLRQHERHYLGQHGISDRERKVLAKTTCQLPVLKSAASNLTLPRSLPRAQQRWTVLRAVRKQKQVTQNGINNGVSETHKVKDNHNLKMGIMEGKNEMLCESKTGE